MVSSLGSVVLSSGEPAPASLETLLTRDGFEIGLSSARAEAPGASRRRGRRGGSGRSGPFRPQREELCVVSERPETRLRLLVDVPRRIRTRANPGFSHSRPDRFQRPGITERLSPSLWTGEKRRPGDAPPVQRRGSPSRMEPAPAAFHDPRNAPLRRRERGGYRNIFRSRQEAASRRFGSRAEADAGASPSPARGRSNAHPPRPPASSSNARLLVACPASGPRPGWACPGPDAVGRRLWVGRGADGEGGTATEAVIHIRDQRRACKTSTFCKTSPNGTATNL